MIRELFYLVEDERFDSDEKLSVIYSNPEIFLTVLYSDLSVIVSYKVIIDLVNELEL